MVVSVLEAAERLQLDPSRVRRLLNSGALVGHRVGRAWVVDGDSLARAASRERPAGRPMSAPRAWGALDLLAGGEAPWLSAVAKSQVRSVVRGLAESSPDRWRAALRRRAERHPVAGHSSSIGRLADHPSVVIAGPAEASGAGLDVIAPNGRPELYADQRAWRDLADALHLRDDPSDWMALVRVIDQSQVIARLHESPGLRSMAIAADCLDDADPRAVRAGSEFLARHAGAIPRNSR
jgi:hypothetical protein